VGFADLGNLYGIFRRLNDGRIYGMISANDDFWVGWASKLTNHQTN
jgi:hypothetical protein